MLSFILAQTISGTSVSLLLADGQGRPKESCCKELVHRRTVGVSVARRGVHVAQLGTKFWLVD
jgi:hypothetical protein